MCYEAHRGLLEAHLLESRLHSKRKDINELLERKISIRISNLGRDKPPGYKDMVDQSTLSKARYIKIATESIAKAEDAETKRADQQKKSIKFADFAQNHGPMGSDMSSGINTVHALADEKAATELRKSISGKIGKLTLKTPPRAKEEWKELIILNKSLLGRGASQYAKGPALKHYFKDYLGTDITEQMEAMEGFGIGQMSYDTIVEKACALHSTY